METPKNRYNDSQVAEILRRAAELQQSGEASAAESGSSQADIVRIGAELGIGSNFIRSAILESGGTVPTAKRSFWGGPASFSIDRIYDGEAGDQAWQALAADSRQLFARPGITTEAGAVREWSGGHRELDPIHLSIHAKDGQTRVRVISDLGPAQFLLALVFGLPILLALLDFFRPGGMGVDVKILTAALIVVVTSIAFRVTFGWMAKRRVKAVADLMAKIPEHLPTSESTVHISEEHSTMETPENVRLGLEGK